jgi:hypothetical protein
MPDPREDEEPVRKDPEEPGKTPGKAEGTDPDQPESPPIDPGRTPGQAEGEET